MSDKDTIQVPEEFRKVIGDFVTDIQHTFPEYSPLMSKWWKDEQAFSNITDDEERQKQITQHQDARVVFLYKFAMKKYPPVFSKLLIKTKVCFLKTLRLRQNFYLSFILKMFGMMILVIIHTNYLELFKTHIVFGC